MFNGGPCSPRRGTDRARWLSALGKFPPVERCCEVLHEHAELRLQLCRCPSESFLQILLGGHVVFVLELVRDRRVVIDAVDFGRGTAVLDVLPPVLQKLICVVKYLKRRFSVEQHLVYTKVAEILQNTSGIDELRTEFDFG